MAAKERRVIDAEDLTDADRAILDELHAGARTKKALVDETGLHRNTVGIRLDILEAGDVIRCIHDTTALYELVADPRRPDAPGDADPDAVREAIRDAREAYEEVDGDRVDEALTRLETLFGIGESDNGN